ncbi:MAG: OmpA family protein [Lentisphaeria bacterium]
MAKWVKLTVLVFIGGILASCKSKPVLADDAGGMSNPYSNVDGTNFNGFGVDNSVNSAVIDEPLLGPEVGLNQSPVLPGSKNFNALPADQQNLPIIYFANDQYNLNTESRAHLASLATFLKSNSNIVVVVEGHCSAPGSEEYNRVLSEKRAQAARHYLISLGVNGDNVDTVAYGEERLVAQGNGEENHSRNRRCQFVLGTRN